MLLHEQVSEVIADNDFTVSEWIINSHSGLSVEPPYVVVNDVDGYGVYADGIVVIPVETVQVHFIYRESKDSEKLALLDEILKPFGYTWSKQNFTSERVMIKTYTLEG